MKLFKLSYSKIQWINNKNDIKSAQKKKKKKDL